MHPIDPRGLPVRQLRSQSVDRGSGKVGAPIFFAVRRQLRQQQPCSDSDLEHPSRVELADPCHGRRAPFPHLVEGDRLSGVAAVPPPEILPELCRVRLFTGRGLVPGVQVVVHPLPLRNQLRLPRPVTDERGTPVEHHIPHQLRIGSGVPVRTTGAGGGFTGDHRRLRHRRMRHQCRLDLPGLDPESPHLHLLVHASDEIEHAVGRPPHHVSGSVHPRTGLSERARYEPFRRQPRPAYISSAHPEPGDIQLPRRTYRHRHQSRPQHEHPHVTDRHPDRASTAVAHACRQLQMAHVHSGFGDSIHVHQNRSLRTIPREPPA
ncbi:Uncharacterised protein [Rhodococcus wratislaviensis]|uniref:Uncharacterized protein n=1 Tax=Rhodococcus wratislaviensis TaxID=44752 RepID=A0AB38F957_RHOWR|nr:Uncharacterised protein [Rhodococcus wratislaviensis]